jgi:hypothetical protein
MRPRSLHMLGTLGYWAKLIQGLFKVGTPIRCPWGRLYQTPCSYARRSGCLYILFDQDPNLVFLSFLASNQPCCLLQCLGTTPWERLRHPLVFFIVLTCKETCFSSRHYSTYFFFFFFFGSSYRPSFLPWCTDTTLWVRPWRPLNFFIIVSIYWKSASYRSSLDLSSFGKTTNRSAAKLIYLSIFLDRCACYSTCR